MTHVCTEPQHEDSRKYQSGDCKDCYRRWVRGQYISYMAGEQAWIEHRKYPGSKGLAKEAGVNWYYTGTACAANQHPRRVNIKGGRCLDCRSPRTVARMAGETRYVAKNECVECGTYAPRRTYDCTCTKCLPDRPRSKHKLLPDTVIVARKEAIRIGMDSYRTGKACVNGHEGWRYTVSSNCITCHRLRGKV